jgi:anti-sigma regulatory factor (Ser/Thr protein kinase)
MNANPNHKVLLVANQIEELPRVEAFLEEAGEAWELSAPLIYSLNLALEEALANIISYGYDDQDHHEIEIALVKDKATLTVTITDDGHEYDPTLKIDPDISLPAEERQIGGLGIFLIKKIMDKVEYQRKENRNHLILTKKIES